MNYLLYIDDDGDFVILPEDHGIELAYVHGISAWEVITTRNYLSCDNQSSDTEGYISMRMDDLIKYQHVALELLGYTAKDSREAPYKLSQEQFDRVFELVESLKKSELL